MFDGRVAAAFCHQSRNVCAERRNIDFDVKNAGGNGEAPAPLQWVARPPGSDTHRPAAEIDKGVRGFDLED
jgi:hypothetical protein